MQGRQHTSYGGILKSSSLVGGSKLVGMVIGVVRTKFAAVLIGPAGVGLVGTFFAIQQFVIVLAGLGLGQSGVRDISSSRGAGDEQQIAETVSALRKLSCGLGVVGASLIALLSYPVSQFTFGDDSQVLGLILLGISVFMGIVSAAQRAILQGFRQIGQLAKAGIYGATVGSVASVLCYWWLGVNGVIPAILSLAAVTLFFTWRYAARVEVRPVALDLSALLQQGRSLLGLGLAFMWNGLLIAAMAYVVRLIILREFDLAAVGVYSAAFAISGMVVNFVLNAMGADYFPRLSEVSEDHPRMVQLVNEQVEIGVLLALPALTGLIVFAPWLVKALYTAEFEGAIVMVRWFALGCFARVFQWPLGFVMMAKHRGRLFAIIQTCFSLFHLSLIWVFMAAIGLEGVSMAFATNYLMVYWVVFITAKYLIGFKWTSGAGRLVLISLALILGAFLACQHSTDWRIIVVTIIIFASVVFFCFRGLCQRMGDHPKLMAVKRRLPVALRRSLFPESA